MHSKLIFGSHAAKYWFPDFRDSISGDKKPVERVNAEQAAALADEFYKKY